MKKNNQTITFTLDGHSITMQSDIAYDFLEKLSINDKKTVEKSKTTQKENSKSTIKSKSRLTHFDDFAYAVNKNTLRITTKNGGFLYAKAPRQALNERIKSNGGKYDKDCKAWIFTSEKKVKEFIKNNSTDVTTDELNLIYEKWDARIAKINNNK